MTELLVKFMIYPSFTWLQKREKKHFCIIYVKKQFIIYISRLSFFSSSAGSPSSAVNRTFNCLRTGNLGTGYFVLNVKVG